MIWYSPNGHGQQLYSGRLWHLNDAQLLLRKKMRPMLLNIHQQSEPLMQGGMDGYFHVVYSKFWPHHSNVETAEIETHSTVVQFWCSYANCSLIFLFWADRRDTRCGFLLKGSTSYASRTALLHTFVAICGIFTQLHLDILSFLDHSL